MQSLVLGHCHLANDGAAIATGRQSATIVSLYMNPQHNLREVMATLSLKPTKMLVHSFMVMSSFKITNATHRKGEPE
jgi:hypothetical protein